MPRPPEKLQGKRSGKNGRQNPRGERPLKVAHRNPEVHLTAVIDMLNERHGNEWSFTIIARIDDAQGDKDGSLYVVSNDDQPQIVTNVVNEVVSKGLWPASQD